MITPGERVLLLLIAAPGLLIVVWILARVLVWQRLRARRAAQRWPGVASALSLEFARPAAGSHTRPSAQLRGNYRGRSVQVEAGIAWSGSGRDRSASEYTRWWMEGRTPFGVRSKAWVETLGRDRGIALGDAAFDAAFVIDGDEAAARAQLTAPARAALLALDAQLGGLRLSNGGLELREASVACEPGRVEAVLAWQAHALDSLGATAELPAPLRVARKQPGRAWCVALPILVASLLGTPAYVQHLERKRQAPDPAAPAPTPLELPALEVGRRVLANYQGKGSWYCGLVVELTPLTAEVVYQDGDQETVARNALVPDGLGLGSRVAALWEGKSYPARVEARRGEAVRVRFEADGVVAWRAVGQLALREADARAGAGAARPAERVLARWRDEHEFLYPGIVVQRESERVHVLFQDGSAQWCPPGSVRPGLPQPGDAVEVRHGTQWRTARVVRCLGFAVEVEALGKRRWTALARLRRVL